MYSVLQICCLICAVFRFTTVKAQSVNVSIPGLGTLRGIYTQEIPTTEYRVNKFMGVPYAKPPVGELRFAKPQTSNSWGNTILQVTNLKPRCIGMDASNALVGMEDCLYLNIYVPGVLSERVSSSSKLPVMVYVDGIDDDLRHNGDELVLSASNNPVVLVVLNYRRGVLGFLSSGDAVLPGNLGYHDQVHALEWIQQYIEYFGGDKNKTTLLGQSHGALAVKTHLLSPLSEGKFYRAIVQSGPALWNLPDKTVQAQSFIDFGAKMGCQSDSAGIVNCLRNKTVEELYSSDVQQINRLSIAVIDGEFITENPSTTTASGSYNDVDLIIGFNKGDGTMVLDMLGQGRQNLGTEDAFRYCLHVTTSTFGQLYTIADGSDSEINNFDDLLQQIGSEYNSSGTTTTQQQIMLNVLRDCVYVAPSIKLAEMMSQRSSVFVYLFDHGTDSSSGSTVRGPHGAELPYVFGVPLSAVGGYSEIDATISRAIIKAWTTFADTGEPTYSDIGNNANSWTAYSRQNKILTFSASSIGTASSACFTDIVNFWVSDIREVAVYPEASTPVASRKVPDEDKTDILGLSEYQADIAVILLAIGAGIFMISTILLAIATCVLCSKKPRRKNYEEYNIHN